uniref:Secreted protein n=1 Tax=Grammatophora oceanica TaxID=210454 RepID=A0A7S1VV79_9STRA|mmetsp:Transcript_9062/g.13229  ORF Transcript_9062/g.13229 Transcript_9062/m.13229 type:complete len:148 (+) Transcript_9062:93-536(+)
MKRSALVTVIMFTVSLSGSQADDETGTPIHVDVQNLMSGDLACVHLLQFAQDGCKGGVSDDIQGMTLTGPGSPCAEVPNNQGMNLSVKDQYCNLSDGTFVQAAYWGSRTCNGKPEIQTFTKNQCLHNFKLASCSLGPCKSDEDPIVE